MSNAVLIIAHAPLARALRACALHIFPETASQVAAVDVEADASPEHTLHCVRNALDEFGDKDVLVLTDMVGATPCNVATRIVQDSRLKLIAGANLPMLLRAITYRHLPVAEQAERALAGGTQGVLPVETTPSASVAPLDTTLISDGAS